MSEFGTREDAKKQMAAMGLNAPYIGSKETRTEEKITRDRKTLAENVPVLGEAMLAKEIAGDVSKGNYGSAALGTVALGVGILPGGDILNKPIKAAAKKLRKQDVNVANKMLKDVDNIETWKKQNPNPKPQKQNPNIEKAANDLLEGKITGKQYRSVVKENMPIQKIKEVPEVPSFTEIVGALDKDKSAKGIIGLNKKIKDGTRVSSRLDIPAYERFDKWVVSVHDAFDKKGRESLSGDIMGYGKTAVLKNVEFKGSPTGAASISARKTDKGTIARIFGDYINAEPENVEQYARQVIKDKDWTQVGYNPFRHGFFYDKDTGMPIKSADEVIQVGPLVLAKNAQKIKISEAKQVGPKGGLKIRTGKPIEGLQNLKETKTVFNKGGVVPMNNMAKQMDMFDNGGLMDEGGTVDPVSGNDVPPGSTQEEVRDDIPAQLSEGEFVFPADVVRFIGLEKLMKIRQRAKAGLQRMDDMGQMGNSEEAIMPDDLPFSIDDLDMEDDGLEMAQGGVVQAANGTFVQPTPTTPNAGVFYNPASQPTTGVAAAPMQAASAGAASNIGQAVPPVQAASAGQPTMFTNYQLPQAPVPVMTPPDQLPKFLGEVQPGVGGIDYTEEVYVNDAGQTITFRRYKDGSLKDAQGNTAVIPEGYIIKSEADKKVTTGPTKVKTATVQDEGMDSFDQDQEDMKRNQARVDAAKALGYTNFAGFTQGLGSAFGFTNLPKGTVTGIGYIADGQGNIIDPTSGLVYPEGLLDGIKDINNKVYDTLKHGTFDKGTRDIIAKGVGADQTFVQEVRQKMAGKQITDKFKDIRNDIREGKFTSDFATSKEFEKYVNDVETAMENEVKNRNVDFQTGRVINPFEASRRDEEEAKSTPAPTSVDTGPIGYEPGAGDGGYDPGSDDGGMGFGADDAASGADDAMGDGGGSFGGNDDDDGGDYDDSFNRGGLAKQMKRSGLASKK